MAKLLEGAGTSNETAQVKPLFFLRPGEMRPGDQGQALGKLGEGMEEGADRITDMVGRNEQQTAIVQAAQMRASAIKAADDAILNGGDLDAVKEQYQNNYSTLGQNFQTRAGVFTAQKLATDDQSDLDQHIMGLKATQAGQQSQAQADALIQTDSALLVQHPELIDKARNDIDNLMANYQGRIPQAKLDDMAMNAKEGLSLVAAQEATRRSPADAAKIAAAYKLNGEHTESIIQYGQQQQDAQVRNKLLSLELNDRQEKETAATHQSQYVTDLFHGKLDMTKVMSDPAFAKFPEAKENIWATAQQQTLHGVVPPTSNAPAVLNLISNMGRPATDPLHVDSSNIQSVLAPLMKPDANGHAQIYAPEANKLISMVKDLEGGDANLQWMKSMKGSVTSLFSTGQGGLSAAADPAGATVAWMMRAYSDIKAAEQSGKDVNSTLLNPKSPDFIMSKNYLTASAGVRSALTPGQPNQPPLPTVTDAAAYNALPAGAHYIGPDGMPHIKGGQ